MGKVIFISTKTCGKCKVAKNSIPKNRLDMFEFWDAEEHIDFCSEHGIVSVPTLIIGDNVVSDFSKIMEFVKGIE